MIPLLLISILAASLNSTLLHKARLGGDGAIFKFNLMTSLVWCVLLFAVNGFSLTLSREAIIFGLIYGVTQTLFILFKTAAMNSGPVSITTLIGNCSLIVSVAACFIFWREPVTVADVLGLITLVVGILLTTYSGRSGEFTLRWKIYTCFFFIAAAGVGLSFKAFAKSGSDGAGDMMLIASIMMLLSYGAILTAGAIRGRCSAKNASVADTENSVNARREKLIFISVSLISGVLSCAYNRLNIYLSGVLDGVIFFPSFNGGVVVLSTLLSMLLLGEHLGARKLIGIATGIVGICIIGIF